MRAVRWFARGLVLAALAAGGTFASPHEALAADPLPASGLVEILPPGRLVGDGKTDALVHVVLRMPSGAPVLGAKLSATADAGKTDAVVEVGDGVYRFRYEPPAVDGERPIRLTVRGRAAQLGPIERVLEVEVAPARAGRIDVVASDPSIVLQPGAATTISFSLPATAAPDAKPGDLDVRVSSGTVTDIAAMGGNRFVARYQAPAVNFPHLAQVTVVDRRDPARVWGSAVVRLQGKVDYPVAAPAGSTVVLRVAGRDFGPVIAGSDGKASVPVVVPPGVETATLVVNQDGRVTESALDLRVPPQRRVTLFPLPAHVPGDARAEVPVRVLVTTATGEPDTTTPPVLDATAGRVSEARHAGDGIWLATYTPADVRSTTLEGTIQVAPGDGAGEGDSVSLALLPALPASLSLSTEPRTLGRGDTALDVFASLRGADAAGLPGRTVRIRAAGARPRGAVTDLKGGDYMASFVADQGTDVHVRALVLSPVSGNALEHVVLLPSRTAVPPAGAQALTIVTTDAFGQPVPSVPVRLAVLSGGGRVPATVTTDESGVAEVIFEAGPEAGIATVEARALDAVGVRSFWQADLADAPALPLSGPQTVRDVAAAWERAQSVLLVDREGGGEAPMDAPEVEAVAGAPASLVLTADPPAGVAGGDVAIDIVVLDAKGKPARGATVELFATGGVRIGAAQDLGDGHYRATGSIPADLTGSFKVNVVVDGGKAVAALVVPVSEAPPAPLVPEKAVAKQVGPSIDRPWMRVRASALVSTYTYEQSPSADAGTLVPSALGWGGPRGGAPNPVGLEAALRAFVPQVPYFGFDASFRWSRYAVTSASFSESAVDNLYLLRLDAVGRYPFAVGRDEVHVGLKAGFRWEDFVTFRGCMEPGCVVTYEPLRVPALDAGLELGAEFWKMYLVASGSGGFAYGSEPFAANADLHLGWNILKNFFVDLGFGYEYRNAELTGGADAEVVRGRLKDQQILGTLGVGFSL